MVVEFIEDKNRACCFTGHREISFGDRQQLEDAVEKTVCELADKGIVRFFTGAAVGFDLLAAEAVLRAKKGNPLIQLIAVLPCRDQDRFWSFKDKTQYESVLCHADEVFCLNEKYCTGCMHQRNRFMVERSTVCIAYFGGRTGGTAHTIKLAREKGLEVINLFDKLYQKTK